MSDNIDHLTSEVRLLRSEFREGLQRIEDNHVSKEVHNGLIKRVDDLEDNQTWMGRSVIGLVLTAVVGVVIAARPIIGG